LSSREIANSKELPFSYIVLKKTHLHGFFGRALLKPQVLLLFFEILFINEHVLDGNSPNKIISLNVQCTLSFLSLRFCYGLDIKCSPKAHVLKASGTILGGAGNFRRWVLG
jgi:hypothetical protein